jgi:holliday junction DNA helicase RuvA
VIALLHGKALEYVAGDPLKSLGSRRVCIFAAGVGYLVTCSRISFDWIETMRRADKEVTLFVHTVMRDADITLFGFATVEERRVFQILLDVDQVGPTIALSLLSAFGDVHELVKAIAERDMQRLAPVPGLGPKMTEKLVAKLPERMQRELFEGAL